MCAVLRLLAYWPAWSQSHINACESPYPPCQHITHNQCIAANGHRLMQNNTAEIPRGVLCTNFVTLHFLHNGDCVKHLFAKWRFSAHYTGGPWGLAGSRFVVVQMQRKTTTSSSEMISHIVHLKVISPSEFHRVKLHHFTNTGGKKTQNFLCWTLLLLFGEKCFAPKCLSPIVIGDIVVSGMKWKDMKKKGTCAQCGNEVVEF